ncbi:glycosyltransferase 87 family protein [Yinghuangia seranimata]|uniref:glycosyltransferase 87 family protein n=1 Tax=Yinghuangia seranimata TaxID=408067 RepID=UPI00248AF83F|nr:glycosyltransferase 87 family protein [Yinghuangia seranimata]MDI2128837.1 glycosyltransferase 87 family protein [Yinghuangia seranimata]
MPLPRKAFGWLQATTRSRGPGEPAPASLAFLAFSLAMYLMARWLSYPSMVDLQVYRWEGAAVAAGVDLYGPLPTPHGLPATYPPFAGLLFTALIVPAYQPLRLAVIALNLVLLLTVVVLSCRLVGIGGRNRATVVVTATALGIWAEPVFTTFRYGQINLALLALVLWDFTRPASARTRGVGIGIATGIKVTPAIFIVYLLLTRRFRMAAVAAGTFAATVAAGAVLLPDATRRFWTDLLFDTERVGRPENAANQTVKGWIVRFTHDRQPDKAWMLLVAVVAVAGLACAVFAYRRLGDRWGLPVCAVTGLLAAPVAWTHHWVWCVPIALLLWVDARRLLAAALVFWTFAVWAVPHEGGRELRMYFWQILLSGWYVLFGAGFVLLAWSYARREAPPTEGRPAPTRSKAPAGSA